MPARSPLLAGIHVALGLAWLATYTYFVGQIGDALRRPRVRRVLEALTGALLVGLALVPPVRIHR